MSTARIAKPVQRLASLKTHPPNRRLQQKARSRNACPNPSCTDPKLEDIDDKRVCVNCGTVVSDSNIVSEVQFGESSSGAAVVQGSYVGADQSHARSMGSAFKRAGGMDSREITESNGRGEIHNLCAALQIPQSTQDQAFQVFKLAAGNNFIQGRITRHVAAICIYIACRRQKPNHFMLMDFADVIHVNVFKLGQIYKALLKDLEYKQVDVNAVEPEDLVYRFARKLEFGNMTMKVAQDATRIVQRMNRDWMVTGRRPAGICGACLILAARMNNFRRTVREVVYVVKVTDLTINKRLEEFKVTASSGLTVNEFRTIDLEKRHDPPAFYEQRVGKSKKRKRQENREDSAPPANDQSEREQSREPTAGTAGQEPLPVRRDADGFAIPSIPIDPSLLAATSTALTELNASSKENTPEETTPDPENTSEDQPAPKKQKRGRPRASSPRAQPPPITAADIAVENELESEISNLLSDPTTQEHAAAYSASLTRAAALAASQRQSQSQTSAGGARAKDGPVPDTEVIPEDEFADDPEVANCLLSPAEIAIKERIWVHENRDYLRAQQAKMLRQRREEAEGGEGAGKKVVKRRKRKGRMGDMSRADSAASTPVEAMKSMLQRRAYSKKINYAVLDGLYGDKEAKKSASSEGSIAGSTAPSPAGAGATAGGEEDEEVLNSADQRKESTPGPVGAKAGVEEEEEDEDEDDDDEVDDAVDDMTGEALGDVVDDEYEGEEYD
ncbi:MAG: hypothetical protein M1819_004789 [Sarea resinae]|nr:MAG: hypothetical protein M1819_004789 [Sarea resinae]